MMISTKGRYALRVMIDLAEREGSQLVPLKEIAESQQISLKYLESIMVILSKANYITGIHGKGGGYKLNRKPEDYTIGSILKLTEGSLAPVSCLENKNAPCERASKCRTLPLWEELDGIISNYLQSVTLKDLIK